MAAVGETQKDKHGKVILPYTPHVETQHSYVKEATDRGYTVLVMDGPLAAHVVSKLEQTHSDVQFKRVDADIADKLIEKDEELTSALDDAQQDTLKPILEGAFPGEGYKVQFAPMSPSAAPLVITQSEFMRRMKEQQAVGGGGFQMFGDMPDSYEVTVNANHPLATSLLNETDDVKRTALAKQAANLARLSQGLLEGEELTAFIQDGFAQLHQA
jgi:molecular chaperone HtpG